MEGRRQEMAKSSHEPYKVATEITLRLFEDQHMLLIYSTAKQTVSQGTSADWIESRADI